jgi:hypothetical protein
MRKAAVSSILVAVVLLAVAVIAEAQQPTKSLGSDVGNVHTLTGQFWVNRR